MIKLSSIIAQDYKSRAQLYVITFCDWVSLYKSFIPLFMRSNAIRKKYKAG